MNPAWTQELLGLLTKHYGKQKGLKLEKKYFKAFPQSYEEDFSAHEALIDIEAFENLSESVPLQIIFYQQHHDDQECFYLKLLQYQNPIPLSDILPVLENMGLRTYNERPYKLIIDTKITFWISDFSVSHEGGRPIDLAKINETFEEALICTTTGQCENDGLNKLVLSAGLTCRDIVILRAYAKYLKQIRFRYSMSYIEKTLNQHPSIATDLVNLFKTKFNPALKENSKLVSDLETKITSSLEAVSSLDEDRILRQLFKVILATIRTNYFQKTDENKYKDYVSIKLKSEFVPDLPLPHPLFEVFVYSTRFEAIHLRSEKVARGGIRWSDRPEDFRTEILGLMKAQKVKNAIIVPSGAKGGFVIKKPPIENTREAIQKEVIGCYKNFMRGLLDITDNLKLGKVIRPKNVVCYDDEDTYLVVAADKGTAAFSDIANSISAEYDFWLGDAFASGGSQGYDHKKMGITARGAWESIKRHFRIFSMDVKQHEFTVIGIGDMSGDVFGNGMLYTDRICLVAAFDHRDIFLDPKPNPIKTFEERKRLFNLPTSSWQDFDKKIISKGGGVFKRSLKSIPLSPQVKKALGIDEEIDQLAPNELVRAILKAPTDLLFNGGIGTYVKSMAENNADVGDKTNDYCRVNGNELRCKIVGEGGNLGFTQLGRVEYALNGGMINTDFIDNSAGVDCSDHEVNIKILLNRELTKGTITEKRRNQILASLTDEVAKHVLNDNYEQALAMSISTDHGARHVSLYQIYLQELEKKGIINRAVEFLPDNKTIMDRKAAGLGLTSPELAVLLAYSKIQVKKEILESEVPDEPYFNKYIESAIPLTLCKKFSAELQKHPLRREIIATQLTNQIINEMGITYFFRIQTETGASAGEIARARTAASEIFCTAELERLVDSLSLKISAKLQFELLHYIRNLMNLATRWFLRGKHLEGNLETIIDHYKTRVNKLENILPDLMLGVTKTYLENLNQSFLKEGISTDIAHRIAITRAIYTSLNIIQVSTECQYELIKTAKVYFQVGGRFNLVWFRDQLALDTQEGHWNTLSRLTLRDELDLLQRQITIAIMKNKVKESDPSKLIEMWIIKNQAAVDRWQDILEKLYQTAEVEHKMFFIALRELSNWISTGVVA